MLEDYAGLSDLELAQVVLRHRRETGLDYRCLDIAVSLLQEMNVADWPDKVEYVLAYWHGSRRWHVIALASECVEWQYPDAATPAQACCLAWLLWTAEREKFQI